MAQVGLTARRTCQAGAKAEHSDPIVRIRCGESSTDKSYSGDNRLVPPKSSYRRRCSAPRCRLDLSWGWRRSQGFGCSPIKKSRELGSDRLGCLWYAFCVHKFLRLSESSEDIRKLLYIFSFLRFKRYVSGIFIAKFHSNNLIHSRRSRIGICVKHVD
jgi:hypothetical protein